MMCLGQVHKQKGVYMTNDIIKFLGLEEANVEIISSVYRSNQRLITLQKKLVVHYCPICGHRMYSRGIYQRRINHPVMQDGRQLIILINQRRWRCCNPACRHSANDEFLSEGETILLFIGLTYSKTGINCI